MQISPLTGKFGARISGIDLSRLSSRGEVDELKPLIHRHKVLQFPEQTNVGARELAAFAELLGTPDLEGFSNDHANNDPYNSQFKLADLPSVSMLNTTGEELAYRKNSVSQDFWHVDGCMRARTSYINILQAVDVPPFGRDTLFADMEAAYERLSEPVQRFLEGLSAIHTFGVQKPDAPPVQHPVVLTNSYTRRKSLYVNSLYTRAIAGLSARESHWVLDFLLKQTHLPEHQLRIGWKPGDIVLWDDQTTQHYAVQDYVYRRVMRRAMVLQ